MDLSFCLPQRQTNYHNKNLNNLEAPSSSNQRNSNNRAFSEKVTGQEEIKPEEQIT